MRKVLFGIYAVSLIVFIINIINFIKKKKLKNYIIEFERLDKGQNEFESAPIVSEFAKFETILKNEKLEEIDTLWVR